MWHRAAHRINHNRRDSNEPASGLLSNRALVAGYASPAQSGLSCDVLQLCVLLPEFFRLVPNQVELRRRERDGNRAAALAVFSRAWDDTILPEELNRPRILSSFGNSVRSPALVAASDKHAETTNVPSADEVLRHATDWKSLDQGIDSVELNVASPATLAEIP